MRELIGGLILAAAPLGVLAAEPKGVSLDYEIGVVSDYRYRGLSLSDKAPAIQGGVTASSSNGLYGSVWASTIDEYGAGADGKGATVELDYALGWAGSLAGLDIDAAVTRYTYPGGEDVAFFETPVTVSRTWGAWTTMLGGAYAPRQKALGTEGDAYAFAGLEWAPGPLTLGVQAGHESGAFAPGGKWDWSLSATRKVGPVAAAVSYVDSDRAGGGLVASLKASF
jgi:uncharacterized protein (TIGR02001 family)